jgi:DNA-directed RNA polymerase subunit beta
VQRQGHDVRGPAVRHAEFINNNTGEIKSQTVFMGDFPMMTEKGTFIINGTSVSWCPSWSARRVCTSTPRSTGHREGPAQRQGHPGRGAWLEFDVDKRDTVGVRIDRKRRHRSPCC